MAKVVYLVISSEDDEEPLERSDWERLSNGDTCRNLVSQTHLNGGCGLLCWILEEKLIFNMMNTKPNITQPEKPKLLLEKVSNFFNNPKTNNTTNLMACAGSCDIEPPSDIQLNLSPSTEPIVEVDSKCKRKCSKPTTNPTRHSERLSGKRSSTELSTSNTATSTTTATGDELPSHISPKKAKIAKQKSLSTIAPSKRTRSSSSHPRKSAKKS